MNIAQIETNLQNLISSFNKGTFIYDFLLAYGQPKASITRLQQGSLNLSKEEGELAWKKKLFFKAVENEDLHGLIYDIKASGKPSKIDVRFIVVSDFETLLAIDCKTTDSLDIPIFDIPKHFDFFLPLAGMEKAQHQSENPADVKAAERMARLYDEISKDNPTNTEAEVHSLNVFLSRLLFCFFAEDTGIFEDGVFTNSIASHTQPDGSDLQDYLEKLFEVLNIDYPQRINLPVFFEAFPYVNGGLFRTKHPIPVFSRRSRNLMIESGSLQWRDINPDIFGSMIQAVITPEHRGGWGMHYTSVPNIMKVIEPLFLNDLYEEFEAAKGIIKKLNALLQRIWKIKLFDPACGSGNFLIIAYKELRRLEMKIFKEIDLANQFHSNQFSGISLGNFYGIELDDFAHEVAILSLWLAEHQMNREFFAAFGRTKPALPLKETGNIVHGNACWIDWEQVCPKKEGDEIYIMGNPPYLGAHLQTKQQRAEISKIFNGINGCGKLDYITGWFKLCANFIRNSTHQGAFVSTNSIVQGEQVGILWPQIYDLNIQFSFAHTSFLWSNSAKGKAAVYCVIIGLRRTNNSKAFLFSNDRKIQVNNISPYLTDNNNLIIDSRSNSISNLPKMVRGNSPFDGGNLILSHKEKEELIIQVNESKSVIKRLLGAAELMQSDYRWCLWLKDSDQNIMNNATISKRITNTKEMRLASSDKGTRDLAKRSHQFRDLNETKNCSVIIPRVGSSRREYLPCGYANEDFIIVDSAQVLYDSKPFMFGILSSKIHLVWVRSVSGYLKMDFRYSSQLSYNTFPFPPISESQKQELENHVYRILEEREKHSEKTLAQLYDPNKMPEGLREAHRQNDLAVERCYRSRPFESDEERLEYLFKLYEQMVEEEKNRGTLFAGEMKTKKKIK